MKNIKRILSMCMVLVMMFTLVGCGKKNDPKLSSADTVQIYYWKAGYGSEYIERIVNEFNASQSKYVAELKTDADASVILKTLDLESANTYDLYFTMVQNSSQMQHNIKLDDVLDYTVPGESKKIRDKFDANILASQLNYDGEYRTLSSGSGLCGIVYNADLLSEDRIPRTTNELQRLVVELQEEYEGQRIKPWLFYNNADINGYWNFATLAWAAQFDGKDYFYNQLLKAGKADGQGFDPELLKKKDGRYEALKVMEQIITPSSVHGEVASPNFTKVQSLFLSGQSTMLMNGCWLLNETSQNANVAMMKMPLISSIVKNLENNRMSDNQLCNIVDEVDAGKTSSEYDYCSQNDFDRIKEARNMMFVNSAREFVFIPDYSPAIEGAKEFLKYFYSDKGILAFMETLHLPTTIHLSDPTKFDSSNLPLFNKRQFELWEDVVPVTYRLNQSTLFNDTGMDPFLSLEFAQPLCATNTDDRKNADTLWGELTRIVDYKMEEIQ